MKFVESFSNSDIWLDSKGKSDFLGWFVGVGGGGLRKVKLEKLLQEITENCLECKVALLEMGRFGFFRFMEKIRLWSREGKLKLKTHVEYLPMMWRACKKMCY